MSTYSYLPTAVPTIAYTVLHQPEVGVPREEYEQTMNELHKAVAGESDSIASGYARHLRELMGRQSQNIRNMLSEFLHTPIASDEPEVRRILEELLEKYQSQLLGAALVGVTYSYEGKAFFAASKRAAEKRLLQNGRSYLQDLGFVTGRGGNSVYESIFIVEGGGNLDILEHIIRDRLGIYAHSHGKHLDEIAGYAFAAYNLVHSSGQLPPKTLFDGYFEAAIFFSKPAVKYAPFRTELVAAINKLTDDEGLGSITLWQRKLGMGAGKEFILRIVFENPEKLGKCIQWLEAYEGKEFVREALLDDGHMMVKELLF